MKTVTVLGSGNAFNMNGRANACYLLENSAGELMLMDCGATSLLRLQQHGFDFDTLDFLILTHFHGDHFLGVPFLLLQMGLINRRTRPFFVYGPPGLARVCEQARELAYPGLQFDFPIEYREVVAPVRIGAFQVEPFPITHRPESTGYRVRGPAGRVFAFSGDSAFDANLERLVDGVDLAIIELSMPRQTTPPTAHVSLEEILAGRARLRARRLVFSHIYDELADEVRALGARRGEPLGEIAEDGAVFSLAD